MNIHIPCASYYNTFDIDIIMDNNKTVVEDNAMDLFMAGHFLQWVRILLLCNIILVVIVKKNEGRNYFL